MRNAGPSPLATDIILLEDERGYIELCEVEQAANGRPARRYATAPPVRFPRSPQPSPDVDEAAQTGVFVRLQMPAGDTTGPWTPLPWQPQRR